MNEYFISLNGHGVETAFLKLTPAQYSFWFEQLKDEDFDVTDYIFSPENYIDDLPDEVNILWKDGEALYWDDNELIEYLETTPDMTTCFITVQDKDGNDIINEPMADFNQAYDSIDYDDSVTGTDQMMEINSYEKGTIFGGYFEAEKFEPHKLKFHTTESPNGSDYLVSVSYDGQEIVNTEYATRGKGMMVEVWEK